MILLSLNGLEIPCLLLVFEGLGIENDRRQVEFFSEFQLPLFAEGGRANDENVTPAFGPVLADDKPGFDGFAKTYFVSQKDTL